MAKQRITLKKPEDSSVLIKHGKNAISDYSIWWEEEPGVGDTGNAYQSLVRRVKNAFNSQMDLRRRVSECIDLYNDESLVLYRGWENKYNNSLNIVKSCSTTLQAKIAKIKPKPKYLTSDGDYKKRQRSKDLTKFVSGVFYQSGFYEKAQSAWLHGAITRLGAVKIFKDEKKKKIRSELAPMGSIIVHRSQSIVNQNPFEIFDVRLVNKFQLAAKYPNKRGEILGASTDFLSRSRKSKEDPDSDLVMVVEAYKLPFDGETNGRRAVFIENATLAYENWDKDYFPYVFFRYRNSTGSFYGESLAEDLKKIQLEIRSLMTSISKGHDIVAKPRTFIPTAGNLKKSMSADLNNEIGSVYYFQGNQPPIFFTPQAASSDTYKYLEFLESKAYFQAGISAMSAGGVKPAGLNSGKALREFSDVETERFSIVSQCYEQSHITASRIIVDMASDLYDDESEVYLKDKSFIQKVPWKDVRMDADDYIMQCFPASKLPDTPSGRIEAVQELVNAQYIDREAGFDLLDFPDLENYANLTLAGRRVIEKDLYNILHKEEYQSPDPDVDLKLARKLASQYFLEALNANAPDDVLDMISRYREDVQRLIDLSEAESQAMQQQMQPMPAEQQSIPPEIPA